MAETAARFRGQVPLLILLLWTSLPSFSSAADEPHASLVVARWQIEAFSAVRHGLCCWVTGPQEALRLEITPALDEGTPIPSLASVLSWRGDGWTLVLGQPGQGTLNRWNEQWRNTPPGLEEWIRGCLSRYPTQQPSLRSDRPSIRTKLSSPGYKWRASGEVEAALVTQDWEAPRLSWANDSESGSVETTSGFRKRMTQRGRGRGGSEEMVRLEFKIPELAAHSNDPWPTGAVMTVSSSRRLGTLRLEILERLGPGAVAAEVFLPLWPLINFVSPDGTFQGTTSGAAGF
jgi:hypothetical protein